MNCGHCKETIEIEKSIYPNIYYHKYKCPKCNKGHIKLEKDETPGFKDKFFTPCCFCFYEPGNVSYNILQM